MRKIGLALFGALSFSLLWAPPSSAEGTSASSEERSSGMTPENSGFERDDYCNALELTDHCREQMTTGLTSLPAEPGDLFPDNDAAARCFITAGITTSGGGFNPFSTRRAMGHGQYVCDHYNTNLTITVLVTVENGTISIPTPNGDITVPGGVGQGSVGQWACANSALCLVSSQQAEAQGIYPYFTARAIGSGVNPVMGPAQDSKGSS